MSWTVRAARMSDRDALVPLWKENDALHARLVPSFFRRGSTVGAASPSNDRIAAALRASLHGEQHAVLVADDEAGRPCGLAEMQIYDAPDSDVVVPKRRVHLENLIVATAHRRRGCGRALVEASCAWARRRGAVELVLTVWEGNQEAEQFYAAMGYRCISRVLGTTL